jgi:uncharacterized membrane protein
MLCNKCGFKNEESSKYCSNCGNKLVIPGFEKTLKKAVEPNKSSTLDKNYKKIFNICFYPVIGCVALIILLALFKGWAGFIGTIFDIFVNIWIWLFIIFIFIFRKNHKVWSLTLSIVFGFITLTAAAGSLLLPILSQLLE